MTDQANAPSSSAAPTPDAAPAAPSLPAEVIDEVEKWFREHMTNSIVSQSTEIFNKVRGAVDDLKARLAPVIAKIASKV